MTARLIWAFGGIAVAAILIFLFKMWRLCEAIRNYE